MRFSGTFASPPQKIYDFPLEDYMTHDERVLNLLSSFPINATLTFNNLPCTLDDAF